jgi:hypothetical protein
MIADDVVKKVGVGVGGRYPKFIKGLAQYLHKEKGLERLQVQAMIILVTGISINKETLKGWLYQKREQLENKR